jgi:hypothetical protein
MAICNIVKKSLTEDRKRSDPEYFSPRYDQLSTKIEKHKMHEIGHKEISSLVTDGDHGNPEYSEDKSGYYYIKSKDLTSFGIDFDLAEKVTEPYAKKLGDRCALHEGEVLLSTVGTVGAPCIALGAFPESVISRDIAKIVPNDQNILPEYLYVYLATDFCQLQIEREVSGSVQGGLYLHALKRIAVHKTSMQFQERIKTMVEAMIELNRKAKKLYDLGKQAIDLSISKNENGALKFLDEALSTVCTRDGDDSGRGRKGAKSNC